ncbi:hypothetical protein SPI_04264 [Niveomyces insectorum RCEF 264]|uniref:Dienelactone hydrolase domain-containing protein n=1 Tax=Niveomyces insectorum RCEF 264 TaxID=1081102 RepID=A0A167VKL2_9HYPO|nr:hypothetical protein SPI_04264 [Niveomyces insectorum RCEF 264]
MFSARRARGFQWDGQPQGRIAKLGPYDAYVADADANANDDNGSHHHAALLLIPDVFGWTARNTRLLADHYARETGATVYLVDLFRGHPLDRAAAPALSDDEFLAQNLPPFLARRAGRTTATVVMVVAVLLPDGGRRTPKWASSGTPAGPGSTGTSATAVVAGPLVDAAAVACPSLATARDVDEVAVPLLVLAPEYDDAYTPTLKQHTFTTLTANGVALEYLHFPEVAHGALLRGDPGIPGERAAMVRAMDAAVGFFRFYLNK